MCYILWDQGIRCRSYCGCRVFSCVLFFGGKGVYRVTNSNFAPLLSGPDKGLCQKNRRFYERNMFLRGVGGGLEKIKSA